jgi:hypothetical protein
LHSRARRAQVDTEWRKGEVHRGNLLQAHGVRAEAGDLVRYGRGARREIGLLESGQGGGGRRYTGNGGLA